MATSTLTTLDAIFREMNPDWDIESAALLKSPFMAMLAQDKKARGDQWVIPVQYGLGGGRSATASTAITNRDGAKVTKFNVTAVRDFSIFAIDGLTVASGKENGALVDALEFEVTNAKNKAVDSLCRGLFRSSAGNIAQISTHTNVSGTILSLQNVEDAVHFNIGDEIKASTLATGASLKTGTATITNVNYQSGTLTTDAAWSGQITGFANTDYLYVEGDATLRFSGLEGWIVGQNVAATSYFGVDRTLSPTMLAGWQRSQGGDAIEECLYKACTDITRVGGQPDFIYMHPSDYRDLVLSLGSKIMYTDAQFKKEKVVFPFKGVSLAVGSKEVTVLADPFCQRKVAWVVQSNAWQLKTVGPAPKVLDEDGLAMYRVTNDDAYEGRIGVYGNLVCKLPKANCRVDLA